MRREESVWSGIASWYDQLIQQGSGPHETAVASLVALLPDVRGCTVIDVACGQGLATRAVATAGAGSVVGVDSAVSMIEIARRTEPGARISWLVDDAERLESCEAGSFDGATCQLGLMDIADLDRALRSIHRVLRPGGWFVFVIGHPCFLAPDAITVQSESGPAGCLVTRYFEEEFWRSSNPRGIRGRAGNYHRPLGVYINALLETGFGLDAVDEPRPTTLLREQQPVYQQVPIFLSARVIATEPRGATR
jgi:ubiquinone/menaquinone biosynthesis C-methylase UbiE